MREIKRLIKYTLAGGVDNLVQFSFLYLLTSICGLWYMTSAVISVIIAAACSFVINNIWTFRDSMTPNGRGYIKYLTGKGLGYLAYLGCLYLLTESTGVWYMYSALIATAIVYLPSYIFMSWFVWRVKVWQVRIAK